MDFRIASTADADALAEMRWTWRVDEEGHGELGDEPHDEFVARTGDFLAAGLGDRWTVFVADDGNRILATIWVYRVPKVPSPGRPPRDFGYVTNVYTVPDRRGEAIGTRLLQRVTAWAHEVGLEMLVVWPSDRSIAFYQRQGYALSTELHELDIVGYEG